MSETTYPFDRDFRLKIIALCLDNEWYSRVGRSVILPEYFEVEDEIDISRAISEYYEAYGKVPSDPDDVLVMCKGEYQETIDQVFDKKYEQLLLARDKGVQWAREQAAKIAILDSIEDIQGGDLRTALERIEEAVKVGSDLGRQGLDVVDDVALWLYDQWVGKVRTGWPHIDQHLEGGLGVGELGTILAPSNRGKSMALINIAYGAAGLGSGKNVVIFTHEMSEKVYAKRIGARMTFRFPKRSTGFEGLKDYEYLFRDMAEVLMPGKIRVIGGSSMTTVQIEASLERLIGEGFEFDLIIDDYPDLIVPARKRKERRFELSDTYEWYRRLGEKFRVPVWAASQTNRNAYNKEIIMEQDIAEDIGKVNISDVIVAICQTKKEADEDRCRLFMAKVRDGLRNVMFDAKFYPRQQAIITTNKTVRKDRTNNAGN